MIRRCAALVVVGAVAMLGCTRPENAVPSEASPAGTGTSAVDVDDSTDASGTTEPETDPAVSTSVATTSTTTSSTTPPSTTPPTTVARAEPTTTTTPPTTAGDLTLIFDGVLPYRFGDRDVNVVPGLAALLGPPVSDELTEYPDVVEGTFVDASGEETFIAPFGRTVCFADSLCVQFGAGAPETLLFSGWRIDDVAGSDLATDAGIVIGSTWAEHADVISLDPFNSCVTVGYAIAGGVDITLSSPDEPFAAPDPGSGEFVTGDVDPSRVTVVEMRAGRLPEFVDADC
jgi:hypothetical protein